MKWHVVALGALLIVGCGQQQEKIYQPTFSQQGGDEEYIVGIENLYVGSQESSILNVLHGHAAAGATWLLSWKSFQHEHPEMAAQLEVKWQTETLPNYGWVVRHDISQTLAKAVGGLSTAEEGRAKLAKLGSTHFERATDETYRPVRQYLKVFSETVRHIDY